MLQQKKKDEGLREQNSGYTLTQVSKFYLDDDKYQKRSINTIRGYKQLLNNWILPELGDIKIRSIEESDLEKLYDSMRKKINPLTNKPLSETYITHCHKLIKSIYNYAKKKKWILSNPTDYVINAPKFNSAERDYYSFDEMQNVYELLNNYHIRFKTAITILFNAGLRRGELFGLKWEDIINRNVPVLENGKRVLKNTTIFNINKEVIAIDKKLLDDPDFLKKYNIIEVISDSLVAITPKTEKSIRNIVIANRCFDLLQEYKQYQIDNGFKPTDKDYVFRTLDNLEVWNPNYLTKEWKYFVENNNLKKITVHDIRHSHATYLLSLGIPPQDVARRLGHSEPATTLKIYTHSNLIQDQKIVNIISQNEYYDIEKEHEKKDSYIFPMSILSILCNDKSNEEDLFATLDWFFNTSVEKEKIDLYLDVCKKYICDVNPQLNSFAEMIENLNENDKKILFGGINAIFNKNNELCLEQINDIDKYNIYDKKI